MLTCLDVLFNLSVYCACMCVLMSVHCGSWCPHWSLLLSSLVCAPFPPHLTGDLDGHWWDHASWHSSEASPMSLVRHVEPCLDPSLTPSCPIIPIFLSLCLSLSSPHSPFPQSLLSFHVSFVLFTPLHVVFLFFFLFLSHTCRGKSKGKKKNY